MTLDDTIVKDYGLVVAAVYTMVATNPTITENEIATYCCISVSSVKRSLKKLQQLGYIEIKVNKPNPNTYKVLRTTASPTTMTYGEFGHVRVTETEFKKLQEKYPKTVIDDYIQRLDTYLHNNRTHKINGYSTHYATIKLWIDGDIRQNGGYTTHRQTKSINQMKEDEETIKTIQSIEMTFLKSENDSPEYEPSIWDVQEFYDVSSRDFRLHKGLHSEIIAKHQIGEIKVPREMCFGHASREYLEELQLKLHPNYKPKSGWFLVTEAMVYIERYQLYYIYLDKLKEKAKTQSQEFLDYVGYHEGDE